MFRYVNDLNNSRSQENSLFNLMTLTEIWRIWFELRLDKHEFQKISCFYFSPFIYILVLLSAKCVNIQNKHKHANKDMRVIQPRGATWCFLTDFKPKQQEEAVFYYQKFWHPKNHKSFCID